jgi:hypothetical protein
MIVGAIVAAGLGVLQQARGQSPAVGTVLLREDFSTGPERANPRAFGGGKTWNIPDTWEWRDGAAASIYDRTKHPGKGHGKSIDPHFRGRDIRVSYRVRFDSDASSISMIVNTGFPDKTGLPLWHLGDANAQISVDATKADVSLYERCFTRDINDPRVKDKTQKPGGLLKNMIAYGLPGKSVKDRIGLKVGEWTQFVVEVVGPQWTYWVNGTQVLTMTQEYADCDKETVNFIAFGPLLLDDIVIEELPRPEPIDLVILAGQSNAVGYDAKPSQLPADARDKDVLFWWRCGDPPADEHDSTSGGKWTQLQPQPLGNPKLPKEGRQYGNFAQADGGFGPEIGFARELLAKEPGRKLAIVKAAFSGTGLRTDWNPHDSGDGGSCYRALFEEVRAALAAGRKQGLVFRPRALLWVQGESDATPQDAENYAANLEALLKALRGDLAAKDMTVLVAVNTKFKANPGPNPFVTKVIEAQKQVSETLPRCDYVDTSAATIANAVHFDAAGTLDVGRCFAEALLSAERSVPSAGAAPPAKQQR